MQGLCGHMLLHQLTCQSCTWDVSKVQDKSSPRAKLPRSQAFHPRSLWVRSAWKCKPCHSVWSSLSLGKHFHLVLRAVPARRLSIQHLRSWLGTAICRQIWQFRARKHKGFLPTGMHPTPGGKLPRWQQHWEQRFSPSAAFSCLAPCLQLESCVWLLCLPREGGT